MSLAADAETTVFEPRTATYVVPSFAPHADAPVPVQRGSFPLRLHLRHGGSVDVVLRWQVLGVQEAPLLIVLGGISAHRQLAANAIDASEGWWPQQVRRGGALDPFANRLLSIDWIGADGALDAAIDPDDQAQALQALLDHLQVRRVTACIGASYGAMVGLHLAKRLGARLGHLVVLNAAHRPHPFASAWRAIQRRIVRLGTEHEAAHEAVALARQLAVLSYRTPGEFGARFADKVALADGVARCAAEPYLDAQGERFANRFAGTAFLRLSESIDLHDIDPVDVPVPVTVFAARSDQIVPVEDARALAVALPLLHRYHEVDSVFGHDSFLKEDARVHDVLLDALRACGGAA
ncbi:MAG TPA: homoserine O-succinyltransferase [Patescibacteria group bacterium]|nr:homoserine O-succinyltransferase [Patescibacteria group bacterium]